MDLNKNEMLRLLSYLEGELQARDITIAALKVSFLFDIFSLSLVIRQLPYGGKHINKLSDFYSGILSFVNYLQKWECHIVRFLKI